MSKRCWFVAGMVLAGLTGAGFRLAAACEGLPCLPAVQPPVSGGTVPANALVIPVRDAAVELTLSGPKGMVALPLHTDAGGAMFRAPDADLTPGIYTLTYDEPCTRVVNPMEVRFAVGAASAYPTAIGTAVLYEAGVRPPYFVFATVSLTSDTTFLNFSGLARLMPQIDGETASDLTSVTDGGRTVTVEVDCSGNGSPNPVIDSCGEITMVPPGTHNVTFSTSVTGAPAATVLSTSLDVTLDCGWLQAIKPNPSATPAMNSGCAVRGSSDGAPPVLGIGLAALGLARRRRSPSRPR